MIHYLSFRDRSSLMLQRLPRPLLWLDPVGGPSSEQNSEWRFSFQVFGEQRDTCIHSGSKQHHVRKAQSFYNSTILTLNRITAHIGTAASIQLAIISFTYTMLWENWFAQDILVIMTIFLSLLVHIYIQENDSYLNLSVVQKLWKADFCL